MRTRWCVWQYTYTPCIACVHMQEELTSRMASDLARVNEARLETYPNPNQRTLTLRSTLVPTRAPAPARPLTRRVSRCPPSYHGSLRWERATRRTCAP